MLFANRLADVTDWFMSGLLNNGYDDNNDDDEDEDDDNDHSSLLQHACGLCCIIWQKCDINLSLWWMFVVWFEHEKKALALRVKLCSPPPSLPPSLFIYSPYSAHYLPVAVTGRAVARRDARSVQCAALTAERLGLSPAISSCRALECRAAARALPRGRSSTWSRSSGSDGGGSVTPRSLRLTPRRWETTSPGG